MAHPESGGGGVAVCGAQGICTKLYNTASGSDCSPSSQLLLEIVDGAHTRAERILCFPCEAVVFLTLDSSRSRFSNSPN